MYHPTHYAPCVSDGDAYSFPSHDAKLPPFKDFSELRDLLFNKISVFTWRGFAAPGENWDFTGILFYGKPLKLRAHLGQVMATHLTNQIGLLHDKSPISLAI
jgi:hypothetical protein